MARPTKFNEERSQKIIEALRGGNTRKASAEYAGINQDTLADWAKRYSDFSDSIKKAEADAEVRNVAIISKAASETWQAAAWWLERRRHEDWKKRDETALTGKDGKDLKIIVERHKRNPTDPQ
jgi:hypothetical protein